MCQAVSPNLCAAAVRLDVVALVVFLLVRLVGKGAAAVCLHVFSLFLRVELLFLRHFLPPFGRVTTADTN